MIGISVLVICLISLKGMAQASAEKLSKNENLRAYVKTSFAFIEEISNKLSRNEIVELQSFFGRWLTFSYKFKIDFLI